MSQLFSRVFLQILDSSIAEDYHVRYTFEDFLKLADYRTGVVDMTREAMSRRLNVPMDELNRNIAILEAPDPKSRNQKDEGRRLRRLDEHRDWGWQILNWNEYEAIRNKVDGALRVERHREKKRKEAKNQVIDEKYSTEPVVSAEEIYEAYPYKVGKPAALRAILKAMKTTPPERLLEITRAFSERKNGDVAFVAHPATWFNQERYNDDPSTWERQDQMQKPQGKSLLEKMADNPNL